MIKVLLVEDEVLWQQGIQALLETEPDIQLVHVVDNADDALIFFDAEPVDVVLLDWKIRGLVDGLELGRQLEGRLPPHRMILVTGSPKEQIPPHPYGYVPKPRIATDLIAAIRQAYQMPACREEAGTQK